MNVPITLDRPALNAALRQFIRDTGRAVGRAVKQQAKLFLRDLIGATPPFGKHAFRRDGNDLGAGESYAEQRAIGERATRRDVKKVYRKFSVLLRWFERHGQAHLAHYLGQLMERGDANEITKVLRNLRGTNISRVTVRQMVEPAIHEARRNNRGRVTRKGSDLFVLNERSLDQYIDEKVSHVGRAKAGWITAAQGLGLPNLPMWIRRHSTPGMFVDDSSDELAPSVTVGNLIDYADELRSDTRNDPFEAAVANRIRSMRIQAQKIIAAQVKKAGGRVEGTLAT